MIHGDITEEGYEKSVTSKGSAIDWMVERYKRRLPLFSGLAKMEADSYEFALACEAYMKPESSTSYYLMRRLQQFSVGYALYPQHIGETIDFVLDDTAHRVYVSDRGQLPGPNHWMTAVQCSWVMRDKNSLSQLAKVDVEQTNASCGDKHTVYTDLALVYQSLLCESDARDALLMAMYSPTTIEAGGHFEEYVYHCITPQLDAIATVVFDEGEQRFNQAIENALLLRQAFHTKHAETAVPRDALSLSLMGLAALAYDRLGYRVTVENRYIPQWLVERQDWSQLPPLADDHLRLNYPIRTQGPEGK